MTKELDGDVFAKARLKSTPLTRMIGKYNNIFILYSAKSMYSSKRFTIKAYKYISLPQDAPLDDPAIYECLARE